jgi:hypothetical protein
LQVLLLLLQLLLQCCIVASLLQLLHVALWLLLLQLLLLLLLLLGMHWCNGGKRHCQYSKACTRRHVAMFTPLNMRAVQCIHLHYLQKLLLLLQCHVARAGGSPAVVALHLPQGLVGCLGFVRNVLCYRAKGQGNNMLLLIIGCLALCRSC